MAGDTHKNRNDNVVTYQRRITSHQKYSVHRPLENTPIIYNGSPSRGGTDKEEEGMGERSGLRPHLIGDVVIT